MSFNRYYSDELAFLKEMGKEFEHSHPKLATHLARTSNDPDVERLLEGFSFLTGRIREKLDDEFPQLTQALLNILWPHYLRPMPAASILEFKPRPNMIRERITIPRGAEILSVPVEGTRCRFRTCLDVDLYPIVLENVVLETPPGGRCRMRLLIRGLPGVDCTRLAITGLRFHLSDSLAPDVYFWLFRNLQDVAAHSSVSETSKRRLPRPRQCGFGEEESLLPFPKVSFQGYRLLQEYFTFPEKFWFFEFFDFPPLAEFSSTGGFDIVCNLAKAPPPWRLSPESIRLHCTPIVNLFESESHPLRITHERPDYRIRPELNHSDIYAVNGVKVWSAGTLEPKKYSPCYGVDQDWKPSEPGGYYRTELRSSVVGDTVDTYASFVLRDQGGPIPPPENAVFNLTCTNGMLTSQLRAGDVHLPSDTSPEFAQFKNISRVSAPSTPPISGDLHWRLITHLALNPVTLKSAPALRHILDLYNRTSHSEAQAGQANARRIEGITSVQAKPEDFVVTQTLDPQRQQTRRYGTAVRGTSIELTVAEDHFAGEGDLFSFGTLLDEFFALYSTVNSFTRLRVKVMPRGEVYHWSPRLGRAIAF